jgi:hypothetical protein
MDFDATIDLIIKELKEASEIIDDLKKYPGVPHLQVELAKMKCRSAGDVIAILKNSREYPAEEVKEPPMPKKVAKPSPIPEAKPLIATNIEAPSVKSVHSGPSPQPAPDVIPEVKTEKQNIIPVVPETITHKKSKKDQEAETLAEQFIDVSGSFYEKLAAEKNEEELAEVLKSKPITSLTDAIGLNDKFLFIREIFQGNQVDYNQAIARLENVESMADARAVIMSYTGDNTESEAVNELLDLVKRKLPSNE